MRILHNVIILCLFLCSWITSAEKEYVDYQAFKAWRSLAPELANVRVTGLTQDGHDLWAKGELRMPAEGFLRGDFRSTGNEDWVVDLETGGGKDQRPAQHLLIVTRQANEWKRLFLHKIEPEDGVSGTPVWSREGQAIGMDFGKTRRVTAPATMTWGNGEVVHATAGYVIEKRLISQIIRWNPKANAFVYEKRPEPEEWETE